MQTLGRPHAYVSCVLHSKPGSLLQAVLNQLRVRAPPLAHMYRANASGCLCNTFSQALSASLWSVGKAAPANASRHSYRCAMSLQSKHGEAHDGVL